MRVLIIEDYVPSATVTSMYLEHSGFQCDIVANGHEAMDKIKHTEYNAVLMDIRMKGFDGYQTTQAIRTLETETNRSPVKIIAVTGLSHSSDKEKCLNAGMNDYLQKPFDLGELKNKIMVGHQFAEGSGDMKSSSN